jgi:hypothetical protein
VCEGDASAGEELKTLFPSARVLKVLWTADLLLCGVAGLRRNYAMSHPNHQKALAERGPSIHVSGRSFNRLARMISVILICHSDKQSAAYFGKRARPRFSQGLVVILPRVFSD